MNVKLLELAQAMVGLDIKVAVTLEYSLLVYQRRLRTLHTAQLAEAVLDQNTRTRIASEAAVRQNVSATVREWVEMSWNS